jgi:putative transposase
MARPLRVQFPGAVYHVMSRGNARGDVFVDDHDRREFLRSLWRIAERLDWWVWAYCLMDNHYHLLVQTAAPNLGRGMHDLNGAYSLVFNRRHDRVGHVFQGRYKAIVVDHESYLRELVRYIVLNPVRSHGCASAADWRWSSYRATMGQTSAPARLITGAVLRPYGPQPGEARRAFAEFVQAGLSVPDPTIGHRLRTVIGREPFIARVAEHAPPPSPEVPRVERAWTPLEAFEREGPVRDDAIRAAYATGAYTQAAIARYFGLDYSWISRIIRKPRLTKSKKQDLTP